MKNFWQILAQKDKSFFCLAPMEDVTDIAFREMFVRCSKQQPKTKSKTKCDPITKSHVGFGDWVRNSLRQLLRDWHPRYRWGRPISKSKYNFTDDTFVMFTEFVPSDGLEFGNEKAQEKLRAKLSFTEAQRPIVAQIFGGDPERMGKAAKLVKDLGFDGVDINMGCPDRTVEKQGAGSNLIKNPDRAIEIIKAVQRATKTEATKSDLVADFAVSVKTRIGYRVGDNMQDWLAKILATKIDALTVHLRTRNEMSKTNAHWDRMSEIIKLRNEISPDTIIIGNGDVASVEHSKELAKKYGCDGIMVGRGAFGKPNFFSSVVQQNDISLKQKTNFLNPLSLAAHCLGLKSYFLFQRIVLVLLCVHSRKKTKK